MATTTTLEVSFVSQSASFRSTYGWYNSVTGMGGILFADTSKLAAGATATFSVNTADVGNIQFFLVPNGAAKSDSDDLAGAVKVIQLPDGSWAVADVDASGNVITRHGQVDLLSGTGAKAFFTETTKNAGAIDYASSAVGAAQTAASLAGDTADGATGLQAWEDAAATRKSNGTYTAPGDADYNDAVFRISVKPTANADTVSVSENGPAAVINVLANDVDATPGAVLRVSGVNTAGLRGTVSIAGDGSTITYNPGTSFQYLADGQTATETFTYTATDQFGGSATAKTTVTVVGANDGPTITMAKSSGSATEDRSTSTNGTISFKDADFTDIHTVSVVGGDGYVGTFSPILTADSSNGGTGSVKWTYSVANSAIQDLAAGQSLTQNYTVTIADGHGGSVAQVVTITINGTNDDPEIKSAIGYGTVAEGGALTTSGAMSFKDIDASDEHTATATALGSGYVGTLTPIVTTDSAGGTGTITWTYSVDGSAIDFLAAGQTRTQKYKITVSDGAGGTDHQFVFITLTGSNDAPVVTASTNGTITELGDGVAGENTATRGANGTVTFTDSDWADSHTVSVSPQGSGYKGGFSAYLLTDANSANDDCDDDTDVGPGTVKWNFSVSDGSLDFLAAGQTLVQGYDVTISDGNGGSVTQVVTITLTGTNDAPTITSSVTSGAVTELADEAPGEYTTTLTSGGTIAFKDVDLADVHAIGVTPAAAGYLGTLVAVPGPDSTGTGTGSVAWTFSVNDGVIDFLEAGQQLTQSYTVSINDGHGGVVSKVITVTITGAADVNHAPVIGAGVTEGAVQEDGVTSAAGTIAFSESDFGDGHSVSAVSNGPGYLGTFTPTIADAATGDGTGQIAWSFDVDNGLLQSLTQGETRTQSYTVTLDDGHGGTASQVVTIVIDGTNDAPVITTAAGGDQGAVVEAGNEDDGTAVAGTAAASGTLTSSDVDTGASATWSGSATGTYGSFVIDTAGVWTYTLDNLDGDTDALAEGAVVTESFTATVTDEFGASANQVVVVTITGTNDGPVAVADTAASDENQTVLIDVLANDSDVDAGDSITLTGASAPSGKGVATIVGNRIQFDPGTDFDHLSAGGSESVQLSYGIVDAQGAMAIGTVTLTILGSNDGPVANPDAIDGGAMDGWTYNPANGHYYRYVSSSASWGDARAAALADGAYLATITSADENAFVAGLSGSHPAWIGGSDADTEGTWTWADGPEAGQVFFTAGTPVGYTNWDAPEPNDVTNPGTVPPGEDYLQFSPGGQTGEWNDERGPVQQSHSPNDGYIEERDGVPPGRLVEAGVGPGNAALAGLDTASGNALNNDTDIDDGDTLTVVGVQAGTASGPLASGVGANIAGSFGTLVLAADGAWTYNLDNADGDTNALAQGQTATDVFTYTIADTNGATASTTITIDILGTNDAPVITTAAGGYEDALAAWTFEDNGTDVTGNGHDVGLFGGASYGPDGLTGHGLALDGNQGSYAQELTNSSDFDFANGDFTIQVWTKFDSVNDGQEHTLIEDFTGGGGPGWTITTLGGQTQLQFYAQPAVALTVSTASSAGWHQAIVQRDGSTLSLYWDGVLAGSTSVSGALPASSGPLLIGARNGGDGRNFTVDGYLDDVAIWSRALTPSEIAHAWNGGAGVAVNATSGQITELANGAPDENAATLSVAGAIGFGDVDLTDHHTISTAAATSGYRGSFSASLADDSTGDGLGSIAWSFSVDDSALDDLAAGQTLVQTYSITVADGYGGTATQDVTITIVGAADNSPPVVLGGESAAGTEDNVLSIPAAALLANDSDPDGDTITIGTVGDATHGLVALNGGTVEFTPDADYSGQASFTYTVTDNQASSGPVTVNLDIAPVADAPILTIAPTAGADFWSPVGLIDVEQNSGGNQFASTTAALTDGGFAIAWRTPDGGGSFDVAVRTFNADGSPRSSEMLANTTTSNEQGYPTITALADGGFMVAWYSIGQAPDAGGYGIYGQRFDAAGSPTGGEVGLANSAGYYEKDPSLSSLADGGFVLAFQQENGVNIKVFEADGTAGPTTVIGGNEAPVSVAGLADGSFVVAYHVHTTDWKIYAQTFDAAGVSEGAQFEVSGPGAGYFPAVSALPDGGYVVTWAHYTGPANNYDIFARQYDASGAGGPEIQVAVSADLSSQQGASVTGLDDGGFVVTWSSLGQDGSGMGVYARHYGPDGAPIGGEQLVPHQTIGDQVVGYDVSEGDHAVTQLADGRLLITWTDGAKGDGPGIWARVFAGETAGPGPGAGSEDTSIALPAITASVTDSDGSEQLVLRLGGFPDGATFSKGALDAGTGEWVISEPTDIAGLSATPLEITPPANYSGHFDLSVTAIVTDSATLSTGAATDTTSTTATINVDVSPVADVPTLLVGAPPSTDVTPVALTGDILVGTYSGNPALNDGLEHQESTITALAGGGFVVAWDSNRADGTGFDAHARIFDADGNATTEVLSITPNGFGDASSRWPSVAGLHDGGFVIAWPGVSGVETKIFDAAGIELSHAAIGGPAGALGPTVTTLADGDFIVSWTAGATPAAPTTVWVQRFDPSGVALTGPTEAPTFNGPTPIYAASQAVQEVAALADGGYVVVWQSNLQDSWDGGNSGSQYGIYGQRYDAANNPVGTEFQVNTSVAGSQEKPAVAGLANGGFVVTWTTPDGNGRGVAGQVFDATGAGVGVEFEVDNETGTHQEGASVVALPDGGFLTVWRADAGDGQGGAVLGQRFDDQGSKLGSAFVVEAIPQGDQQQPDLYSGGSTVSVLADGTLAVTWFTSQGFNSNVSARLFELPSGGATEDHVVTLPAITAALNDLDGSETLALSLSGYPVGATFSIGHADGDHWVIDQVTDLSGLATTPLTMTPPANYNGSFTLSMVATATDTALLSAGTASDTASTSTTYVVTIAPINDAPSVIAIDAGVVGEDDAPVTIDLLAGQTDIDSPTLAAEDIVVLDGDGAPVTFSDNGDGTITIDPQQFNGLDTGESAALTVSYGVSDGAATTPNTASLIVLGADDNHAPIANDDNLSGVGARRVGYYDMAFGQGVSTQVASIVAAGDTPVLMTSLSDAELADIDILVVQNPDNGAFGSEYLARLTAINQAVANGLTLIIHDRYVDGAESILPGSAGFAIVRDFTDHANVDFRDDAHPITNGPGGHLDDGSLDGGNSSSHGFAIAGTLPADADLILSTGDSSHIVTFSYAHGAGHVVYSSIPLDYYLNGSIGDPGDGIFVKADEYAANLIDYVDHAFAGGPIATEDDSAVIQAAELLANDTDADADQLAVTHVDATSQLGAAIVLNPDGTIDYTPSGALDYLAEGELAHDTFTYTVSDGHGGTDTATVSLDIVGTNDMPTVQSVQVQANSEDDSGVGIVAPLYFELNNRADDVDSDDDASTLSYTFSNFSHPGNFVATATGLTFNIGSTFQHLAQGQIVDATAEVVATDSHGSQSAPAILTFTVVGANDAPVAVADTATTGENSTLSVSVLVNDTDIDDGHAFTLVSASAPAGKGSATVVGGQVVFSPGTAFDHLGIGDQETVSISYTMRDEFNATSSAVLTVTVTGANDAPNVAANVDPQAALINQPFSVILPANLFADVDDGDAVSLSVSLSGGGALPGWLSYDSATQTLSGTPPSTAAGLVQIAVTGTDLHGAATSLLIPLTVLDGEVRDGTEYDDNLTGTINGDHIRGLGGNDLIGGLPGADLLEGGSGFDTLNGEAGDDVLDGGTEGDQLTGGSGNDVLYGREGYDTLNGGVGSDTLEGGADDDSLSDYEGGSDILRGGDGNDDLNTNDYVSNGIVPGADLLDGGDGNDNLSLTGQGFFGGTLLGGAGNDNLYVYMYGGNGQADTILADGGIDNDNIYVSYASGDSVDQLQISGGDGNDTVNLNGSSVTTLVDAGSGNDTLIGLGSYSNQSAYMGTGADLVRLTLNSATTLNLGADADSLMFDSWNGSAVVTVTDFSAAQDTIEITTLLNTLSGWDGSSNPFGAGVMRLVQSGADALLEVDANGGGDSYVTLIRFQNLDLTTTPITAANFNPPYPPDGSGIFGQALAGDAGGVTTNDSIVGTIGDDTIGGLAGADTLSGGNGNDTIDGGADSDLITGGFGMDDLTGGGGADAFAFARASDGPDHIVDFESGVDALQMSASGFGGGLTAGGVATVLNVAALDDTASHSDPAGYFIFVTAGPDQATLYWDGNGGSGADAVSFARLTNVNSLAASDLLLV